jgi:hypothetical protein
MTQRSFNTYTLKGKGKNYHLNTEGNERFKRKNFLYSTNNRRESEEGLKPLVIRGNKFMQNTQNFFNPNSKRSFNLFRKNFEYNDKEREKGFFNRITLYPKYDQDENKSIKGDTLNPYSTNWPSSFLKIGYSSGFYYDDYQDGVPILRLKRIANKVILPPIQNSRYSQISEKIEERTTTNFHYMSRQERINYILNTENNNKDNNAFRSVIARRKLLDKFNIKGFDLLTINNKKGEEEEEDDEEEINLNRERLGYRDNESESEGDIEIKEIYDNSEIKNGLFFEKYDEIYGVKPLNEKKFKYLLDYKINFYELGPKITKLIIIYIKQKLLKNKLKNKYDFDNFNCSFLEKNHISIMSDAKQIKNYKIVAMTTTGCSKYSAILELCNFNTIIIEEAAEVLESHVLSTLTPKVNHLILIGDHQQLRPKPYNYEIATKYNFDISMFERLINNDIPYAHLKYQRRMKPKFANFVRIIYGEKDYVDYEDVKNNEKVEIKGLTTDMLIITHNKYEIDHEGLKSKQNDYEAKYISRLCEYLLKQGYNSDQITILTFYIGQVILIKKYLKQKQIIDVRVSSIDNYQGEECDIILLSLVRSNERYEIGFLQSFNRVCVAFSRAKLGFFIIGNLDCIVKGEELLNKKYGENGKKNNTKKFGIWAKIQKEATKIKIIDNKIILRCQNHKKETIIKTLNDFDNCPEGGCLKICRKRMKCGHACQKACHNFDCNDIKCLETITKINENCEIKKHYCTKICSGSWPKCEEKVNKKLLCGHNKKMSNAVIKLRN